MKTLQKEKIKDHFERVSEMVIKGKGNKLGERQEELYSIAGLGMKRLLNTLCDLNHKVSYLELGAYRGGTLIAALWDNDVNAYAVDNFKYDATAPNRFLEEGHPNVKTALENTIDTYKRAWKGPNDIKVIEANVNDVDLSEIDSKLDIIFHDADKKGSDVGDFLKKYKTVIDKYSIIAFTKVQDVGVKNSIEKELKDADYVVLEEKLIPDTAVGLDGKSAVMLYYLENKTAVTVPTPKKKEVVNA